MFRKEEALEICQELIDKHRLEINILGARQEPEEITFFYSAPERVDFRNLASDLRQTLQINVHLQKVGAREKARYVGGVGKCGKILCCNRWLGKIPKECTEGLSGKKGICGKPLCCLLFEKGKNWTSEDHPPTSLPARRATPSVAGGHEALRPGKPKTGKEKTENEKKAEKKVGAREKKPRKKRVRRLRI